MGKRLLVVVACIWIFFFKPIKVGAQIKIVEALVNPIGDENSEWISVQNESSEEVNLTNWTLDDVKDGGSKPYLIQDAIIKPQNRFEFPQSLTGLKLNNTGDTIRLLNINGELIDEWEINEDLAAVEGDVVKRENPNTTIPTHTPTAGVSLANIKLKITAVLACPPKGEVEKVSISNEGSEDVNLEHMLIKDKAENRKTLNGTIKAQSTLDVEMENAIINNDGDEVFLLNANNTVLSSFTSGNCQITPTPNNTPTAVIIKQPDIGITESKTSPSLVENKVKGLTTEIEVAATSANAKTHYYEVASTASEMASATYQIPITAYSNPNYFVGGGLVILLMGISKSLYDVKVLKIDWFKKIYEFKNKKNF